jgi:copper(I)-binding protein
MRPSSRHAPAHRAAVVLVALLALLPASALGQSVDPSGVPASNDPAASLRVEGAWARTSPMMELAGAAFMVLINDGPTDDALIAATTPVATTVELHQTTADASGVMTMAPVPSIPVPAGGSTELAPGGYHVMLIGLVEPLVEGAMVPLTLTFEGGAILEVGAVVASVAPGSSGSPMSSPAPMGSGAPDGSPGM